MDNLDNKVISNIRVLTQEMISNAKSGHPGIALGAAPIMHALYSKVLKHTSADSKWYNRDRFILAAGHGSSLLYAVLHLCGYKISLQDLKDFRKLGSITPGHPEYNCTDGVDATSGPLGQGIAMGTGLAIAENYLANKYNKEDIKLFDNYTYVLCGDGDLQEGVTVEAISVAGNLKLNKLIVLYDSNDIQLDGKVSDTNTENVKLKVESMHWNYLKVEDGEDVDDIVEKINLAKKSDKPTLIEVKTIIGRTSSLANTCDVHGAPLKLDEVLEMRKALGGEDYGIFDEVKEYYQECNERNKKLYLEDMAKLKEYAKKYPAEYVELEMYYDKKDVISKDLFNMPFDKDYSKATRYVAGEIMDKLSEICPMLIGGSADLAKSVQIKGGDGNYTYATPTGRNICFGVREHSMAAICNGICLNEITRAFCGGFFVFSDYMKPGMRMSALMGLPVMYFFSHDTIAVGEDGPTHQPIEQLTMLRSIPNMNVIRPCGREEVKEAIEIAYNSKNNPTVVVLSRQGLAESRTEENAKENLSLKGAYVISKEPGNLDAIIFATGTEVELAIKAQKALIEKGVSIRVVSMPSTYLFDKQPKEYQEEVLPKGVFKLGLEMGEAIHLYKYIDNGKVHNITTFGASGKASDVIKAYNFTPEYVAQEILNNVK